MTLNTALLVALLFSPPPADERPVGEIGQCNPRSGAAFRWTKEVRQETRARVKHACRASGSSPLVCAFADAVVIRESSGRPGVRHRRGQGEDGLGAMGLNLASHRDKWPGKDEDPMFCQPEVSFAVAHEIIWRAFTRYQARNFLEVQAIYSGKWDCWKDPKGRRQCRAAPTHRTVKSICRRMEMRGFSCYDPITRKDLGRRTKKRDRRDWATEVMADFDAKHSGGSQSAALP